MAKKYPILTDRGEFQVQTHNGILRWVQGTVGGINTLTRPSNATPYSLGDEISNSATPASALPWVFPNFAEEEGGRAFIRWVLITSSHNITFTPYIWLFNSAPTMCGDNAAFSHDNADEDKLIVSGLSTALSVTGVGSRSVALALTSLTGKCNPGTKDIYGVLVSQAYTPIADQTFRVKMLVEY